MVLPPLFDVITFREVKVMRPRDVQLRRRPARRGWRFALLLAVLPLASYAQAQDRRALVAQGQTVFRDQGCYGCHTVGKSGTPIAPDLSRIGARHDEGYLARWLRDPSVQRPTAHMPKLDLSDVEVKALAAYLASLR